MEIVDDKLLLIRTRTPQKYAVIPRSRVLREVDGGHEVAVYWGLDEARVLRNLGVKKVQSPIVRRYSWPGRYRPFAHQIDTASFLTLHRRAFCFNEPGTAKTISALYAADYLMTLGKVRRVLVLCPLSIMQSAWLADINNSVIHRSAIVAHHVSAARRSEMIKGPYEIVIINYDGLTLVAQDIIDDGKFDLVIVDEANVYKNPTTQRWKTLAKVIRPETLVWMMTGTPASQSPMDAFGLAKIVNPEAVPRTRGQWQDMVMHKVSTFRWVPRPSSAEKVFSALQPAIRYSKAECLDLPPVLTQTRLVPLTPQQSKYYALIRDRMVMDAAGETVTAVNAAARVSKLLQIASGAAYSDEHEVVEFDCSNRLSALMEVIDETDRKVIVFAPFRSSIDTIAQHLTKNNVLCERIHGDVSAGNRTRIFSAFQSDASTGPRVLVVQPQSASHGVTLTAADTVVFWGPVMSVETYLQCIARADRVGQNSDKVTVVHLQGSKIEERMYQQLEKRIEAHDLIIDLYDAEVKECKVVDNNK